MLKNQGMVYNRNMGEAKGLSMVIPCFNEAGSIRKTLEELEQTLKGSGIDTEIIVVDDGSTDGTAEEAEELKTGSLVLVRNEVNLGYGASIKAGIRQSRYDWVGICDADGTYPVEKIADMIPFFKDHDMVTGIRTGDVKAVPLLRRPAKWFLNRFSSYLAGRKIRDVNSGLRCFKKEYIQKFWSIFPNGFSFTTTTTMMFNMENLKVKTIPVNYYKREGKSKIRPIKDTYNFFLLIMRITMLFNPLRIFMPAFFTTLFFSFVSLGRDIYLRNLTDTTVLLFVFSLIIFLIGLLADLVNRRRI